MQKITIVRDGARFTAYGQEYNITAGNDLTVNDAIADRLVRDGVAVPAVQRPVRAAPAAAGLPAIAAR